jgi:hypothetical protein
VGRPFDLADAAAYAAWRERKLDTRRAASRTSWSRSTIRAH